MYSTEALHLLLKVHVLGFDVLEGLDVPFVYPCHPLDKFAAFIGRRAPLQADPQ